jgi:predicted secreted hydrolase
MKSYQFDAFSRLLAQSASRRGALRAIGGASLAAVGLTTGTTLTRAQDATPAASPATSDTQAALDALDNDTRDAIARALWQTELRAEDVPPEILTQILDPKNSNEAFALRFAAHLLELIAEPSSFVQSYAPRFETMLTHSQSLNAHQAYIMENLIGPEGARGFPPLPTEADFEFPAQNAIDLQSRVGWYFFVGTAEGSDGEEYGIELMFFRYSLVPPDLAAQLGLTDTENQVVELHFSVAKAGDRHYQAKPILVAGTTGLLSFDSDGLGAAMGKNVIRSASPENLYPIQLQAWGQDDGEVEPVQFSIDLTFSSGRDYLLQGAEGCSPCCDGVGTLYYSIPGLVLDPDASSLTLNGEQVDLTEGTFWFDHQWGMLSATPQSEVIRASSNLATPPPTGWDWFMAQFDGDRTITANSIHSNDYLDFYHQMGTTPPGTMTVPVAAKYMDPDEVTHDVAGTLSITEWILSVDSPDPVTYPPTYTWYPNRWEFAFGEDVPEDIRSFVMVPIVQTGQSGFFANGAQYSEGAVYLLDPSGAELGRGFAESVGYANTLVNMLRLVGLPATDDMLALFGGNPPDDGMVLASQAYAYLNAAELQEILGTCLGL